MIRTMQAAELPALRELSREDLFLSRILSLYDAYGFTAAAQFWVQVSPGKLHAVLCLLDGVMTLSIREEGNRDELSGFLYALQPEVTLCDAEAAAWYFPGEGVSGPILHYDNGNILECDFPFDRNPPLKEVYQVLKKCQSPQFPVPPWEPFYLDLSHRIRHNCAVAVGVRDEKEALCGCGFTAALTDQLAILSGVCVLPSHRRKGFGKLTASALISQLPQPDIYVFCNGEEPAAFYESLGFTPSGRWTELRQ